MADPERVRAVVDRILREVRDGTHVPNPAKTLAEIHGGIIPPEIVSTSFSELNSENYQKPHKTPKTRKNRVPVMHESVPDVHNDIYLNAALERKWDDLERWRSLKTRLVAAWQTESRQSRRFWARWSGPKRMKVRNR